MEKISQKAQIAEKIGEALLVYRSDGPQALANSLHENLLTSKVRFPLLEYAAEILFPELDARSIYALCSILEKQKTIGGNVLIGKLLGLNLELNFAQSLAETKQVLEGADIWYISDIIGERVFGQALQLNFSETLTFYKKQGNRANPWLIRAFGAGGHRALKRGLSENHAIELFEFLLTFSQSKEKEIRQGIGWAAKSAVKFHPVLALKYGPEIAKSDAWFRRKVQIGLERYRYGKGNSD
ncbi:hypothetical protein LAG90_01960 [Marinilongibacter aquaticus]|uniref:hypothetical protein n=1 Tax=Marinilongibacter aquaticus TaxID=2975157 RepID=UPI0021BD4BBF|nr:hypothetical protein [Marinilongibacter aquaticus]UBM59422.1 hypothetical protein LAG90_01960 [Marinilongibacter aquaticus]